MNGAQLPEKILKLRAAWEKAWDVHSVHRQAWPKTDQELAVHHVRCRMSYAVQKTIAKLIDEEMERYVRENIESFL